MNTAQRVELRWLRISLVAVWLWTAVCSVLQWNAESTALLVGLPPAWDTLKPLLIGAGALLDLVVGLWLWLRPGRMAYGAAMVALLLMTVLATAINPSWWLHPFGPLSKNLPIAAALVLLWRSAEP